MAYTPLRLSVRPALLQNHVWRQGGSLGRLSVCTNISASRSCHLSSPLERALWGINQQGRKVVFKVIAVCGGSARLASWFSPEGFQGLLVMVF